MATGELGSITNSGSSRPGQSPQPRNISSHEAPSALRNLRSVGGAGQCSPGLDALRVADTDADLLSQGFQQQAVCRLSQVHCHTQRSTRPKEDYRLGEWTLESTDKLSGH